MSGRVSYTDRTKQSNDNFHKRRSELTLRAADKMATLSIECKSRFAAIVENVDKEDNEKKGYCIFSSDEDTERGSVNLLFKLLLRLGEKSRHLQYPHKPERSTEFALMRRSINTTNDLVDLADRLGLKEKAEKWLEDIFVQDGSVDAAVTALTDSLSTLFDSGNNESDDGNNESKENKDIT